MEEIRTISEDGANYELRDNEVIGKEYPKNESEMAHKKVISKTYAYPEYGWRAQILDNGNVLIIVRKK